MFGERSEEHTSELQSHSDLVCRLLLEKKKRMSMLITWATYSASFTCNDEELSCDTLARLSIKSGALYFAVFFFFNDTATTEIYTLSLHDALPICARRRRPGRHPLRPRFGAQPRPDRKSTRLNSSHTVISYAVFCLKKKKKQENPSPLKKKKKRTVKTTRRQQPK